MRAFPPGPGSVHPLGGDLGVTADSGSLEYVLVLVGMDEGDAPHCTVLPRVSGPSVLPAEMHRIGVTEAGSPSSDTPQPSLSLSALTFSNADPQPGTAGSRGGKAVGAWSTEHSEDHTQQSCGGDGAAAACSPPGSAGSPHLTGGLSGAGPMCRAVVVSGQSHWCS